MSKQTRITLKVVQQMARAYGMTIRKTSAGDYRIAFKGSKETVYEDYLGDALLTAQFMYKNKHKFRY